MIIDCVCGRFFVVSYPGKRRHDEEFPIILRQNSGNGNKSLLAALAVAALSLVSWEQSQAQLYIMSTIAKTTPASPAMPIFLFLSYFPTLIIKTLIRQEREFPEDAEPTFLLSLAPMIIIPSANSRTIDYLFYGLR